MYHRNAFKKTEKLTLPTTTNIKNAEEKPNWVIPVVLAIAFFMENIDATAIATSLPTIASAINTDPIALKLAMTAYLVSLSVFIPISGWMADRFTARHVFRLAIVVFMLGSILCTAANSLCFFVISRFIQGMGGAMMVPVGRLFLLRITPKNQLVSVLSWFSIPALAGPLMGPPIGGFITTYFSWHWIFLINIPIGIIGLICASIYMPKSEEINKRPLDWIGFLLSGLAVSLLIFGMSIISLPTVRKEYGIVMTISGLILGYGYVTYAKRIKHPLLDIKIFKNNVFRKAIFGGSIFRIGIGAVPFLLPLMLQLGFHLTPMQSGAITFSTALGSLSSKLLLNYITDRISFYNIAVYGSAMSAIITVSYGLFVPSTPCWLMLLILAIGGLLQSLFFSCINAVGFSQIEKSQMSQATPIHTVAQQASLALGVAIAGMILEFCIAFHGNSVQIKDFHLAFFVVGFISLFSIAIFKRFDRNVGNELKKTKKIR